jgi:nucleoside-diphosphate-sugar epimerase
MAGIALIVGATGIIGGNLAKELLANGWTVYGLSRDPKDTGNGVKPIAANLLDPESLERALVDVRPTHTFITTWTRRATEAENIDVNGAMVRNVLNALSPKKSVQHVALVTGLKHYLGPFDAYVSGGFLPETPLREEQGRLDLPNFYYAQEDELFAAAKRDRFSWSVHRPHTVIGLAVGNAMNMGSTIAVYASICKEIGRKFHFPGSEQQWSGLCDVTDARILAKQLLWAATTKAAQNEAFNITNGDTFRWKWLWPRIGRWFDVETVGFDGRMHPLEPEMADDDAIWAGMATKYKLVEPNLRRVSSAWHTDLDLGRPVEVMTDMGKSRKLGFTAFQSTEDSFLDLFAEMRKQRLIP